MMFCYQKNYNDNGYETLGLTYIALHVIIECTQCTSSTYKYHQFQGHLPDYCYIFRCICEFEYYID